MNYIKFFSELSMKDVPLVGGKNASLGEMVRQLKTLDPKGRMRVPLGFAITVKAYWDHVEKNKLLPQMKKLLSDLDTHTSVSHIQTVGKDLRNLIYKVPLPQECVDEIKLAYRQLSATYHQDFSDVAIRSSATAEDLPHASFAGQQETYLNINGEEAVLDSVKKCMASLFTDRALVYRMEQGFDHFQIGISVGVQKMVRSDKASSGVLFTLDTDSGFKEVVVITSSYGLGENIVKGVVNPDEFHVHKETLKKGFRPIIKKYSGTKELKLVYTQQTEEPVMNLPVSKEEQKSFSLSDDEILELARQAIGIEEHYSKLRGSWCPMDIEWAKDGIDNELYILQARPETIYGQLQKADTLVHYKLTETPSPHPLVTGLSIGQKIATGKACILKDISEHATFKEGDILVTTMTDPDWVPLMKKAAAIITDKGGRTCHAAIVSRELGIPAIIGTSDATIVIHDRELITVDASQGSIGYVYQGALEYEMTTTTLKNLSKPRVPLLLNIADPDKAYKLSFLPVDGVGLARVEFIISSLIKVHPMAVCHPQEITDPHAKKLIKELSFAYGEDPRVFFYETLAQGIGMIAASFYPRPVIVRLSDFKSNEYRNLLAGENFEPIEENPMLGFRGAVRYCDPRYAPAFELECEAFKIARNTMGLTNIKLLIPFVRSLTEAHCTLAALEKNGIRKGEKGLEILMMCEIPSNVILLEEFSKLFDGFSIGSNDLTQFTLAIDRDSAQLSPLFDERDPAVKQMLLLALEKAQKVGTTISICGQAPSDFPEIADYLIEHGIGALSLNQDSVIPFLTREGKDTFQDTVTATITSPKKS